MKVLDAVINTAKGWAKPPVGIVMSLKPSYGVPGANVAWPRQQFDGFAALPHCTWSPLNDLTVVHDADINQILARHEFEDWVAPRVDIELLYAHRLYREGNMQLLCACNQPLVADSGQYLTCVNPKCNWFQQHVDVGWNVAENGTSEVSIFWASEHGGAALASSKCFRALNQLKTGNKRRPFMQRRYRRWEKQS